MSSKAKSSKKQLELPPAVVIRDEDNTTPVAISFQHVTKRYKLYRDDKLRLLSTIRNDGRGMSILANNDLSFDIARGDGVAFLGTNGAGKSTALKMVTGVTYPTGGTVEIHGRVSALLELSAGFDRKLTGRENIILKCQLWGLSKDEINSLLPKIAEFTELGDYLDHPLRAYSSGMKARLGFACASSIDPDILVVDEALSVGDRLFKQKCIARVKEIMSKDNATILFVTHSSGSAKQFCKTGIVLDHGHNIFMGPIADAVAFYENKE